MLKSLVLLFTTVFLFSFQTARSEIFGKVDIGPAFIQLDILESGKTIETRDLWAVKGDATIVVYKGLFIKPGFIWGDGKAQFSAFSIGVGHAFPVYDGLTLLPSVGIAFSYLKTDIDYNFNGFLLEDLTEKFRSRSPYVALEVTYKLSDCWTIMGLFQYAWSRTYTTLESLYSDKSHSCGPNYGLAVEYSLNQCWALTFGVGYNITLSKEKHGLRGKGAKLGLAYYF